MQEEPPPPTKKVYLSSHTHTGAKFKKYVGHSAHVTNVRFTTDKRHVISVGGADNAVFQWRFYAGEGEGEEDVSAPVGGDSDSEESDSDMSDVASLDSDLEKEQEKVYERLGVIFDGWG